MDLLKAENFFNGEGTKDPAFSARDRINRAPKALGFVKLSPAISLTPAGENLIKSRSTDEVFLRQLLKCQVPSPYHKLSKKAAHFKVKPYLELFRLIRHFGTLKFDELMIFGLQLVDYRAFDTIVDKIEQFRIDKNKKEGHYKMFRDECMKEEVRHIYESEISAGDTKTRESKNKSVDKFIRTKARNMRDYTDACVRYLRATGMVNISYVGKTLSIVPERTNEVDYFLKHTDREPCFVNEEKLYSDYIGNSQLPLLMTDNIEFLVDILHSDFPDVPLKPDATLLQLKEILDREMSKRKKRCLKEQMSRIKDFKSYDDIQNTFVQITGKVLYDTPLMLEWNTWRAMTMLDGGMIQANLKFDDFGKPMSTAQGNMADIVCDYGDFGVTVEVTMASGQKQYEMEGEPVTRHLARFKKAMGKPAYGLFIAPSINDACIAHFYALHNMNIVYYGGKSTIIPLPLNVFQKMVEDSYKASYTPRPENIRRFFEHSNELANKCGDEQMWYRQITQTALNWLE